MLKKINSFKQKVQKKSLRWLIYFKKKLYPLKNVFEWTGSSWPVFFNTWSFFTLTCTCIVVLFLKIQLIMFGKTKHLSPIVTNINFLQTISTQCQEIRLWELIKWSPKRKYFDLLSNSLNLFFKEMYRDQFGEFACGYWGLKG